MAKSWTVVTRFKSLFLGVRIELVWDRKGVLKTLAGCDVTKGVVNQTFEREAHSRKLEPRCFPQMTPEGSRSRAGLGSLADSEGVFYRLKCDDDIGYPK